MAVHTKQSSAFVEAREAPAVPMPASSRWITEESFIDVDRYAAAVGRRLPVIVIAAALAGVLGFVLAGLQPLMYEGVTTLLIVPSAQPIGPQFTPATFRSIVDNATLASQVIDELKLRDRLRLQVPLTPQAFLERALSVEEVRATNVVKVKVTLPDAELAATASRRMAEKAILLTQQITQREGVSIQEQLKNHLDAAQQRMRGAEQELLTYKQAAQVDLIKGDTDADLKARSDLLDLTVSIASERARLAAAEAEIKRQSPLLAAARSPAAEEVMRRSTPDAAPKLPPNPATRPEIDMQQLDLTNPYVNPVYQTLDFQIAITRTRIAALEKQRDELINVKKIGGKELTQLGELYRRQIEQARLEANYDLAERVFSELSLKYEQSRTQHLGSLPQLQVVDAAITPDKPLSRHRVFQGLAFASATFLLATLAVVIQARRRRA